MNFNDLCEKVVAPGLCARCGLCCGVCPSQAISMNPSGYPELTGKCVACGFCFECCPGGSVNYPELSGRLFGVKYDPTDPIGHVESLHGGHAACEKTRYHGASGGLVTGLLTYLLKSGEIDGALVVGMDPRQPIQSKGVLARTIEEVYGSAKSKYVVTPSLEMLREVRRSRSRVAVVALPCQVHGLRKLETVDPSLSEKIAYVFGLYCACTTEPFCTRDMLSVHGIDPTTVSGFAYRGGDWPGGLEATLKGGDRRALHSANIKTVLTTLFRLYGPMRCHLCVDALAEYADLSFGDFWRFDDRKSYIDMDRRTLVTQRTQRGEALLDRAARNGAVVLDELPIEHASKRAVNMAMGKKYRAFVRIKNRRKKGRPVPEFGFDVPSVVLKERFSEFLYRCWAPLKHPKVRPLALKFLFSKMAGKIDSLNALRKKLFLGFHENCLLISTLFIDVPFV